MKYVLILTCLFTSLAFAQREEATITRTFGTNSVYPRQFPSSTIRKMNDNEYWLYDSLNTNTIFHRIFPTYIVRKQNTYTSSQQWGVYRTYGTNSVYPNQFPDRYISDLNWRSETKDYSYTKQQNPSAVKLQTTSSYSQTKQTISSPSEMNTSPRYTYSKSLRSDRKSSYCAENPE
jgi:hypothetical protein